ncbi:MAG: hypothetical protein QXS18_03655 [Thermoplasmata archaeon]
MQSNRKIILVVYILNLIFLISSALIVNALVEPEKPEVNYTFNYDKEAKINELAVLNLKEAFNILKETEFIVDDKLLYAAIFRAFENRKTDAILFALDALKSPVITIKNGQLLNRSDDIFVARKIFEVFPEESVDKILKYYEKSSAVIRGNIIRAIGNVSGEPIKSLLIKALDDKTFCEEMGPEMGGYPLRICDIAYNQLVLRYNIKNVLRCIGNVDKIEVRDYHIVNLKSKLKSIL